MAEFLSLAEARERPGLRVALLRGVPSPWSQAAKGLFRIKGLDYSACAPGEGESVKDLVAWTGQASYPAVMYEDEAPRSGWAEILLLAERLSPDPALIPSDPAERARCLGLSYEICGEQGLGWCQRLCMIHDGYNADPPNPMSRWLGDKYGYSAEAFVAAEARVVSVLGLLDAELVRSPGDYFLGPLSAVDVYWATFCNLLKPLPKGQLSIPEGLRDMFSAKQSAVLKALTPALLAHRDRVYERHLELPVAL